MYYLIYPQRWVRQKLQLKITQGTVVLIETCLGELMLIIPTFLCLPGLVSFLDICVTLGLHNSLPDLPPSCTILGNKWLKYQKASHSFFFASSQKSYFLIVTAGFNAHLVLLTYKVLFKCHHKVLMERSHFKKIRDNSAGFKKNQR